MSSGLTLSFVPLAQQGAGPVLAVLAGKSGLAPEAVQRFGETAAQRLAQAMEAESFKGKSGSSLALPAEAGFGDKPMHIVIIGSEGDEDTSTPGFVRLGGQVYTKLPKGRDASVLLIGPKGPLSSEEAADFALGMKLAAYKFDLYITKKKPDENGSAKSVLLHVADPVATRRVMKSREAIYEGVEIARDLVNEPPNVLTPVEFAARAEKLEKLGVEIEILDEKMMKKLGMRALLGVGQGSAQESRVVIMKWMGARNEKAPPIAFIGKGVVFDTGGISIKPAAGMEDMKGDMAGAAAVVGLMHALASRKAKANVIGAIGLVENMPDGNAQRPGDIVKSMSGQTIEIINTDAEGRLVLADVLWHVKQKYNPKFMVNLATLTGAILVALGQEFAGLFSNNDELAERLFKSGKATGEKLWRMPLHAEFDKMIDSKFADMKNSGGRYGGSITAAHFLQRHVDGCPWAHLDIAGTAMGSPVTDINKGWSSGFGVRLLDRLVADHYEG
ncbi:MAG: leucyl aminopeptidase [Rhabdaerophilum sp.]